MNELMKTGSEFVASIVKTATDNPIASTVTVATLLTLAAGYGLGYRDGRKENDELLLMQGGGMYNL